MIHMSVRGLQFEQIGFCTLASASDGCVRFDETIVLRAMLSMLVKSNCVLEMRYGPRGPAPYALPPAVLALHLPRGAPGAGGLPRGRAMGVISSLTFFAAAAAGAFCRGGRRRCTTPI